MTTATIAYRNQVLAELEALPDEYLPFVLQLVRVFRESLTLKPAAASFHQGWSEARQGAVSPISTLWDDIDADSITKPNNQRRMKRAAKYPRLKNLPSK
jgi:hypothetical protein